MVEVPVRSAKTSEAVRLLGRLPMSWLAAGAPVDDGEEPAFEPCVAGDEPLADVPLDPLHAATRSALPSTHAQLRRAGATSRPELPIWRESYVTDDPISKPCPTS